VRERPDVVILDIMMPHMDGLTALGQLRQGPVTKDIPVLLLSAKKSPLDNELGMKAGAAGYLTKPFDRRELVSEIKRLTSVA
jgi:CheY-like chemotaxis protein